MESPSQEVILVTDQAPLSGIGVYATQLYLLLRDTLPGLQVRNLNYFPFADSPPHQPISGQSYAKTQLGVLGSLRLNERLFARQFGSKRALVHLCGTSFRLAALLKDTIATVHDFGARTLGSYRNLRPDLLLVELHSSVNWMSGSRYLQRCRRIIAISETTQQRLARISGLQSTVIHHWTDQGRFHPRPRQECRSRLGLPDGRPIVLNVSAGTANKNLGFLKAVVRALPPEYLLVKIGYPLSGNPGRIWNAGTVSEGLYPFYFNAADAYVYTSLIEGFGRPLLESLASGLPIIALDNPPAREILGTAGRIVTRGARPTDVATSIQEVVSSNSTSKLLAASSLARSKDYDPGVARDLYRQVYLDAMRS
jgi:glycosyltransferase involved in cell wall biosynthesis